LSLNRLKSIYKSKLARPSRLNWLGLIIQKHVTSNDSILDVGCGIMQATWGLKCKSYTGCDVWLKYLDHVKHRFNTIKLDVTKDLVMFPNDSYDVVLCLDVLEHLDQGHIMFVLDNLRRICRKKAIIFTPATFDTNEQSITDSWGLGINEYQRHRCLVDSQTLNVLGFKQKIINNGILGIYTKKP
jgi:2-polyprenyl-3-methyl-5-hydroxy-6-metoxy-1,4-benzoquinol methylase